MKLPLFVLLVLSLVAWPARAYAVPPTVATSRSLGLVADEPARAIVGSPPSPTHRSGTLMIAWCERAEVGATVRLGEWAVESRRWLEGEVVRRAELCPEAIQLAWSGARLVMAIGWGSTPQTELIVLARDGATHQLREQAKVVFEDAFAPSIDADEKVIVIGGYETKTPVVVMPATSSVAPPRHALHVRVLDAATLRIVGARVFRGEHLLRPHRVAEAAGHALRLLGGRLYCAVPDDDPRIVAVRLPSLATESERTFPVPNHLRTPFSSSIVLERLGDHALTFDLDVTYVLGPKLEMLDRRQMPRAHPSWAIPVLP